MDMDNVVTAIDKLSRKDMRRLLQRMREEIPAEVQQTKARISQLDRPHRLAIMKELEKDVLADVAKQKRKQGQ